MVSFGASVTSAGSCGAGVAVPAATISTVGFAAGGALLAGGLLTYLLAPKGEAQIVLGLDKRAALLSVGGVF